jgi:predicted anti-sigma-YlaC factor YlaD
VTQPTCDETRIALGAYVVGSLDPSDRTSVDRHLESCPACRDELADLAVLPGLLGRVDVADVVAGEPAAPPEFLERLLRAASDERRTTRRWRVLSAAAAIAVVFAAAGAIGVQVANDDGGRSGIPPNAQVFNVTDPVSHVTAKLTATPKGWGTSVRIQLTGVQQGQTCSLIVVGPGGSREQAAKWKVNYYGSVDVEGATDFGLSDVSAYEVVTTSGQRLVSIPV